VKKIEIVINHQLKIIYRNQDLNRQQNCRQLAETALLGDRRRSDKHDPGDRDAVLAHQGGAVVPDKMTAHEIERPETHLLVRTEVSRLI
jgi:hypothetical protein